MKALLVKSHVSWALGDENIGITGNHTLPRVYVLGVLEGGSTIARGKRTAKKNGLAGRYAVAPMDLQADTLGLEICHATPV